MDRYTPTKSLSLMNHHICLLIPKVAGETNINTSQNPQCACMFSNIMMIDWMQYMYLGFFVNQFAFTV